jgi:hypothetical protein
MCVKLNQSALKEGCECMCVPMYMCALFSTIVFARGQTVVVESNWLSQSARAVLATVVCGWLSARQTLSHTQHCRHSIVNLPPLIIPISALFR